MRYKTLFQVAWSVCVIALLACRKSPTAPAPDTVKPTPQWFAATFALRSVGGAVLPLTFDEYTLDSGRIKTTLSGAYTDAILFHHSASSAALVDSLYGTYVVKPDSLIFSAPAYGLYRYAAAYDGTTAVVVWSGYPFVYQRAP